MKTINNIHSEIEKFEPVFTIGTVARKLKVAVQTVRMYEQEGLVLPYKTATGRRLYSLHDLERLHCIRQMIVEHGLNIQGIKSLMALLPCWDYMGGVDKDCETCPVYNGLHAPCWSVREVGHKCQVQDCRECVVYRLPVSCNTLKSIIYKREDD